MKMVYSRGAIMKMVQDRSPCMKSMNDCIAIPNNFNIDRLSCHTEYMILQIDRSSMHITFDIPNQNFSNSDSTKLRIWLCSDPK